MSNHLLLLHGYTQNGDVILNKVSKLVSKSFLDNYTIISPNGSYQIEEEKRGWWNLESPEMFNKPHKYENYEDAIKIVQESLKDVKEEDNLFIIGFSQGSVLCEIMLIHNLFNIIPKKVVLISPSGIMDSRLYKSSKIDIGIPLLVIIGKKEGIFGISNENYEKDSYIEKYDIENHEAGHVIPSNSKTKNLIKLWITI